MPAEARLQESVPRGQRARVPMADTAQTLRKGFAWMGLPSREEGLLGGLCTAHHSAQRLSPPGGSRLSGADCVLERTLTVNTHSMWEVRPSPRST